MALYAFDGTSNEDQPGHDEDTNVLKFYQAFRGAGEEYNLYVEGVGTRYSWLGTIMGGMFGMGGRARINEAMDKLEANFEAGDRVIDVVGFSRGAALALEFANEVHDEVAKDGEAAPIRFLGIWDTVASFGLPGNNINLGYELTVPKNVEVCRHAISLDERRATFPLSRVTQDKYSGRELLDIQEVWFRGYHSDVGGGNKNEGLSNIPLCWMYKHAEKAQLVFDGGLVASARDYQKPKDSPKTPAVDRVPTKKRTIRDTDQVHDSVFRTKKAGRFEANNPPKGLAVVDNDGNVVGPFEE